MDRYKSVNVKKHVRSLQLCLSFFFMCAIVSLGIGIDDENQIETISTVAAILNFIMCLLVLWILSLAKSLSAH